MTISESAIPDDGEFHSVSALTGITLITNQTYTIQTIGNVLIKEGIEGNGAFRREGIKEMQFTYREQDLYVKSNGGSKAVIVIS